MRWDCCSVLRGILGASVWWGVAGPLGAGIATAVHFIFGAGALIIPVALIALSLVLMLDLPAVRGGIEPRVIAGTAVLIIATLGLIHIFAGNPEPWALRYHAGGALGAWSGGLLAMGFSSYVAAPLLMLIIVYGSLVVTGITMRQAVDALRHSWHSWRSGRTARTQPSQPSPELAEGPEDFRAAEFSRPSDRAGFNRPTAQAGFNRPTEQAEFNRPTALSEAVGRSTRTNPLLSELVNTPRPPRGPQLGAGALGARGIDQRSDARVPDAHPDTDEIPVPFVEPEPTRVLGAQPAAEPQAEDTVILTPQPGAGASAGTKRPSAEPAPQLQPEPADIVENSSKR